MECHSGKSNTGRNGRTFQNEARATIPELMKRTAEGIASSLGAKADFRWYPYLPVVNNSPRFTKVARDCTGAGVCVAEAQRSPGGEDFAFYQTKIPGFFVWMGVDGPKEWHHPAFTFRGSLGCGSQLLYKSCH